MDSASLIELVLERRAPAPSQPPPTQSRSVARNASRPPPDRGSRRGWATERDVDEGQCHVHEVQPTPRMAPSTSRLDTTERVEA